MQNYKLGEYIRQRRLDLGLTQEQVCAGICESVTLSRFENGKQNSFTNRGYLDYNESIERPCLSCWSNKEGSSKTRHIFFRGGVIYEFQV